MAEITLTYKGSTIAEVNASGAKTLQTAGKYCEGDITLTYARPSGIDTSDATAVAGDIRSGKTGYVQGSKVTGNVAERSASDLTASGDTVTVPAGIYDSQATKSVAAGSAKTPNTSMSVSTSIAVVEIGGATKLQASASGSQSITPTVTPGYVASGTAGTVSVNHVSAGVDPATLDANLVAGNIKNGANVFGVTGTYSGTIATATVTTGSGSTITSITFSVAAQPQMFVCRQTSGSGTKYTSGSIYIVMVQSDGTTISNISARYLSSGYYLYQGTDCTAVYDDVNGTLTITSTKTGTSGGYFRASSDYELVYVY